MENKKIIFIGIVEEKTDKHTLEFLKKFLIQSNYNIIYSNKGESILCLYNEEEILVLIYIDPKDIEIFQKYMGIQLDLLIYNFIQYKNHKIKSIKDQISNCDYCILNGDYNDLIDLPLKNLNGIIMTYGFNNKSSLTVSSYNNEENIKVNLYLQRELMTIKGEKIEPQEFKIQSNKKNIKNVYSILAASTLSLILGNNIWTKSSDNIIDISI